MTSIAGHLGYTAITTLRDSVRATHPDYAPDVVAARAAIVARHAMLTDSGTPRWCPMHGHRAKIRYRTQVDAEAANTELGLLAGYRPAEAYLHNHHWHLREIR